MHNIIKFLLVIFGFGTVNNGLTCWFSDILYDIHDYDINHGGDGFPSHFYFYKCPNCNKKFTI